MATAKSTTPRTTRTRTAATGTKTTRTKTAAAPVVTPEATPEVIDLNPVSKPLYAYVGAADLAVEKLRALPETYVQGVTSARNSAQAQVNQARGSVKTLPVTVREQLTALPGKAKDTYSELVERGHKLVTTVQKSPNTQAALKQAKTARAQAKGATTSALKSVKSVEKVASAVKIG
jgi:hypothetical protein